MSNIDHIITEEAVSWAIREAKARQRQKKVEKWPVITISREYAAGGRSLAKELAQRIGFKIWDKDLLSAIADETGADKRFMTSLDERRRKMISDVLHGFLMGSKHSNTQYFRSLLNVVHTIDAHGKSIVVGRGANFILKSPDTLRVRVVRPFEQRVSYVAELEGLTEKKAQKLVTVRDSERNDFIQHFFKRDTGNAYDYDLVLNSGVFNIEQLADLVLFAYEKKIGKTVPLVN